MIEAPHSWSSPSRRRSGSHLSDVRIGATPVVCSGSGETLTRNRAGTAMAKRARPRRLPAPTASNDPPPLHAMVARWRDPDDIMPDARRVPREITGYRTFCPLRKMSGDVRSGITAAHIMAADKLREVVDVATMGYSSERPMIFVAMAAQPRFGMSGADIARVAAMRSMARVLRIFPANQLAMLEMIVLRNVNLRAWTLAHDNANPAVEKGRLLGMLDRLVQHFEVEIKDELREGRRLPP
jgi:hypothetical protein